jgi:uncharacterized RDD family membrane protein YckC
MLDAIVAVVPVVVFALIGSMAGSDSLAGMLLLPAILFAILYVLFCDCLPGGQSTGKRMLGIAVVDQQSGRPCSPGQSFMRNLLLGILGFFDWIFIVGEGRRRLGDIVAGTIVVEAGTAGAPYQAAYR